MTAKAEKTAIESGPRVLGIVLRVIPGARGKSYFGFIGDDNHRKFFFHQSDVIGKPDEPPPVGEHVSFDVLRQTIPGKWDRAVNIQVVTVPPSIERE